MSSLFYFNISLCLSERICDGLILLLANVYEQISVAWPT